MTHPKDLKYIEEMLPNISSDVIEKQKTLQPGTCVAFGGAFKIPMIIRLNAPDPPPYSSNCDVSKQWKIKTELPDVASNPSVTVSPEMPTEQKVENPQMPQSSDPIEQVTV